MIKFVYSRKHADGYTNFTIDDEMMRQTIKCDENDKVAFLNSDDTLQGWLTVGECRKKFRNRRNFYERYALIKPSVLHSGESLQFKKADLLSV